MPYVMIFDLAEEEPGAKLPVGVVYSSALNVYKAPAKVECPNYKTK